MAAASVRPQILDAEAPLTAPRQSSVRYRGQQKISSSRRSVTMIVSTRSILVSKEMPHQSLLANEKGAIAYETCRAHGTVARLCFLVPLVPKAEVGGYISPADTQARKNLLFTTTHHYLLNIHSLL